MKRLCFYLAKNLYSKTIRVDSCNWWQKNAKQKNGVSVSSVANKTQQNKNEL
jgi:hypothetical protein